MASPSDTACDVDDDTSVTCNGAEVVATDMNTVSQETLKALQAQIEGLSMENADLADTVSRYTKPFRFMDLPREIRDMIYEVCLVVGKVFPRRPVRRGVPTYRHRVRRERFKDIEDYQQPQTVLLLVSQQMRLEAAKIYFSKNLFVISPGPYTWPWGYMRPDNTKVRLVKLNAGLHTLAKTHLRSVHITFDMRVVDIARLKYEVRGASTYAEKEHNKFPARYKAKESHVDGGDSLRAAWAYVYWSNICACRLDYLVLDLRHTYCLLDGFRPLKRASKVLYDKSRLEKAPKRVHVLGTRDEKEREVVKSSLLKSFKNQEESQDTNIEFNEEVEDSSSEGTSSEDESRLFFGRRG